MFSRQKTTGKQLLWASWQALQSDRSLLLLPILASVFAVLATVLLVLAGGLLVGGFAAIRGVTQSGGYVEWGPAWWVVGAFVAYASTVISVFFQVALAAGAMERLDGGDPTVGSCVRAAWGRLPQVLLWSFISATVGVLLRAIAERGGVFGWLLSSLAGVAWAVMTFFVVPLILVEGRGDWSAAMRSKDLMFARWGSVSRSGLRFGVLFLLPSLAAVALLIAGIVLAVTVHPLGLVVTGVGVVSVLTVTLLAKATMTYLRTVLYRYAVGLPVPGIDESVLASAIASRR